MKTPHERLRYIRKLRDYESAAAAARRFGWSEDSYKSAENGIRNITAEMAIEYADAFRVRPGWLLYGEGEYNTSPSNYVQFKLDYEKVPLLSWDIVTNPADIEQAVGAAQRYAETSRKEFFGPLAFALLVKDESMRTAYGPENNNFSIGDEIVFDPEKPVEPGCFVLARIFNKNETVFRQYREGGYDEQARLVVTLHPLNPNWADEVIIPGVSGEVIARLIRHSRDHI